MTEGPVGLGEAVFIFNIIAGVEVALVAIPAGLAYLAAKFLGFDGEFAAAGVGLLLLLPLDLLWRLATMGGGEGEGDEPAGCMNVIWPSGGGHLMFVPMWVVGLVGLPLLMIGVLSA